MPNRLPLVRTLLLLSISPLCTTLAAAESEWSMPPAPRTYVSAAQRESFRDFCTIGAGAASFAQMKAEFDAKRLDQALPSEPVSYGTPFPQNRDPAAVFAWRQAQKSASLVTGIGEAATVIWLATDEPRYLDRAKAALLSAANWDPAGAAGLVYNDEVAFRLWRKLPFLYDQLRSTLTPAERAQALVGLRAWGESFFTLVHADLKDSQRNSIATEPRSHSVRFAAAVGLAGLALYDDLPEARAWFDFVNGWYRDQFPPWGGDDGGWSEGIRYWETGVVSEPIRFEDALHQVGHPDAWAGSFWRSTGYFAGYILQPYPASSFGDISKNGKVNLDWLNARFVQKMARVFDDGYLLAFATLGEPPPVYSLALENYPSGMELLLSDFCDTDRSLPQPADLSELPSSRWFKDIGWVSFHSALGQPEDDINLTFLSSPYASFSHSHAAQNAFVLSAYGTELAVSAGYREFHGSPHHDGYVRQTLSKNAILIDGQGQTPRSKAATGQIVRQVDAPRYAWTTGDATAAYNAGHTSDSPLAVSVLRDVVFVDHRYFIIRDTIRLPQTRSIDWLLHAEHSLAWDAATQTAVISEPAARLIVALGSREGRLTGKVANTYPVAPDPDYVAKWNLANQAHLTARAGAARDHEIIAVLWPERTASPATDPVPVLTPDGDRGGWTIHRPDGRIDHVTFGADSLRID